MPWDADLEGPIYILADESIRHSVLVYKALNHVKVPNPLPRGTIYVVPLETDEEKTKELHSKVTNAKVAPPSFDHEVNTTAGWLRLRPGDRVFGRFKDRNGKQEDDIELFIHSDLELCDPKSVAAFKARSKHMLGPRNERTTPTKNQIKAGNGQGTRFERVAAGKAVNGGRSYTLGPSLQVQPRIISPPATGKVRRMTKAEKVGGVRISREKQQQEATRLNERAGALHDACKIFADASKQLPEDLRDLMASTCEMANCLRIGCHENKYTPSVQLNVVSGSVPGQKNPSLTPRFGTLHKDGGDAAGHTSKVLWYTDIPNRYRSGMFYLPTLWMYVVLDGVGLSRLSLGHVVLRSSGIPQLFMLRDRQD
ncbi:hypothetical protein K474DRAFT_1714026 [Panus rudis PR-1116 ss-1]|nr:hypothetical protein K474DRAFT_1714026 [Panus rudis PR-1116 ss-1]